MSLNQNGHGEAAREETRSGEVKYIFVDPFQPPLHHRAVAGPQGSAFAVVQRFGEPKGTDDAPEVVDFFSKLDDARSLVMQRIVAEANRPDTGNDLYITHVKLRPAVGTV